MPFEIPNYTLLSKLGEGAMAEVWLGEHKRNGRKAAIKVLKPSALADGDAEKLFLREGQVLAGFDHPNIVKIYDNDRVGDLAYLVMEHLSGGTLLERMQRAPISIGEALGLVAQIAGGLEAAHRQQVIHRDLKPANIMLRDETTPVLTDFGASRLLDRSTIYGRDGMIVGTPIYMSPEQVQGQTLSGSSDLYALGILFFELLTGDRPFPGVSFPEIAAQHLYAPIPQLPAPIAMLQPVLERLLAKKPEERYPSAQAFVDDLRAVFIHDEALRLQVGYAGTSMAWSSQLRALGFVLDREQKVEVRRAQGEYLREQDAATKLATAQAPTPTPAAGAHRSPAATAPVEPLVQAPARSPLALIAALALAAVLGGGWWWSQREPLAADPGRAESGSGATPASPPFVMPAPDTPTTAGTSVDATGPIVTGSPDKTEAVASAASSAAETAAAMAEAERAVAALELRNRYIAADLDSVRDHKTGLLWAASDNGADIDWLDAGKYCASLGAGWQLPSLPDLMSLYDETGTFTRNCGESICKVTPAITVTAGYHWSRIPAEESRAWVVDFANGARQSMAVINPFFIRALCVRGETAERPKD
ncbi:MAG: protein kinase [Rhodanobacteraceae bacterium]|nr:protein kinase [Rhodanobacteraceae bacterium]